MICKKHLKSAGLSLPVWTRIIDIKQQTIAIVKHDILCVSNFVNDTFVKTFPIKWQFVMQAAMFLTNTAQAQATLLAARLSFK